MRRPRHAVPLFPRHGQPVLRNLQLGGAIVQRHQHVVRRQHPVQPARNGLPRPVGTFVKLLPEGGVRIRFGQDVPVAVLVKRMLQRVAVGGQLHEGAHIRSDATFLAQYATLLAVRELALLLTATALGQVLVACGRI